MASSMDGSEVQIMTTNGIKPLSIEKVLAAVEKRYGKMTAKEKLMFNIELGRLFDRILNP